MKNIREIQKEIKEWSDKNFGEQRSKAPRWWGIKLGSLAPLMGIVEEIGELFHVTLKHHQGIRGYDDEKKYEQERDDAVADQMIYLMDYCNREGIDLVETVERVWSEVVSPRDWFEDKYDGGTSE